jgi:osmoprotectant transport system permease protein
VIIAGLISDNTAFILQGGLIVGLMAVLIYDAMGQVEAVINRRIGLRAAA